MFTLLAKLRNRQKKKKKKKKKKNTANEIKNMEYKMSFLKMLLNSATPDFGVNAVRKNKILQIIITIEIKYYPLAEMYITFYNWGSAFFQLLIYLVS